jgi:hypothetical protein
MNRLSLLIFLTTLFQCQAFINFKVPPFTITNAQTAAEKQMVGEDRDLEKDGWLVSSIQSSSGSSSISKAGTQSDSTDPEYSGHIQRLNYLSPEVKRYKIHGMIGEGIGGILKINPLANTSPFFLQYETQARKKRIEDVISLTNESRKIILDKQIEGEKKKGRKEEELKVIKQSLIEGFQKSVSKGEFFESSPGKWERL